jgi:hypothetical protein
MRTRFHLAGLAVLLAAGPQVAAGQASQVPRPGLEHARLAYFIGKWRAEGDVKPGPMGPGGKMTSNDTCEWFEG